MQFSVLAGAMHDLERTASRNKMVEIIAQLFGNLPPHDAKMSVYLLQGRVAPPFKSIDVGLGEKLVEESISKATGYSKNEVQKLYIKLGDLGAVAEQLCKKKKQTALFTEQLTIKKVYDTFYKIATASGHGSQDLKISLLAELINNASPLEAKYIVRFPVGRLRLGIGDPTVLDALSYMKKGDKSDREYIEHAYNILSDLGLIASKYCEDPSSLKSIKVQVFMPVRPALAERLPSAEQIIEKLGPCIVEAKYDGFRLQCHKKNDEVEIFSRRMERMTDMLPDVVDAVKNELKCDEIIFEGEALAYNEDTGEFYPFQQTITRKRKYGVEQKAQQMPLRLFAFDILYLDGKKLMDLPLKDRRKTLEALLSKKVSGSINISEGYLVKTAKQIEQHFEDFVSRGLEGLMAKDLNAPYIAGARKFAWIKLKRSYKGELTDTVDLVIIGYYAGRGSRAKLGFGGLLCAVYDSHDDMFKTIAKVGSGFSEEQMRQLKEMLSKVRTGKPNPRINSIIKPTYWVEPRYVITVRADEITKSPVHTCGKIGDEPGYALRFPRMVSDVRTDKRPEDATSVDEIIDMYKSQKYV